jgi:hypothetical protein
MAATMEARWFRRGATPEDVREWFEAADVPPTEEARDDHYLALPGVAFLTLKLRDDRIEAKRSDADLGVHVWHPALIGRCVQWTKWSFTLQEAQSTGVAAPDAAWLTVHKRRATRIVRVDADGTTVEVPTGAQVPRGCIAEVSAIELDGEPWWSLCFEAFGPTGQLRDVLDAAIRHVLATSSAPPPLAAADSFDYAPWLAARLAERGGAG